MPCGCAGRLQGSRRLLRRFFQCICRLPWCSTPKHLCSSRLCARQVSHRSARCGSHWRLLALRCASRCSHVCHKLARTVPLHHQMPWLRKLKKLYFMHKRHMGFGTSQVSSHRNHVESEGCDSASFVLATIFNDHILEPNSNVQVFLVPQPLGFCSFK